MDRSFTSDSYRSKKANSQLYIDLYSGADYALHARYSTLLLHCSVCLIYGTACPILYLIAFCAFFVLHINERLAICYSYKQPAAIDDRLTRHCLQIMTYLPIVSLMFVWWQLGNRQLLDNVLYPVVQIYDVRLSGHSIEWALDNIQYFHWNSAPFVMSCVLLTLIIFSKIIPFFTSWMIDTTNMDLDEGLADYFSALEAEEKRELRNTEEYYRNNYGVKTYDELTFDKIQNQPQAWNTIEGVPTYSIMDNHSYMMQFQYVPTFIPDRELMIVEKPSTRIKNLYAN